MSNTAQLKWRCRSGVKELEVLLIAYLEQDYPQASLVEQQCFAQLVELPTPLLYDYFLGKAVAPSVAMQNLISKLQVRKNH